MCERACINLIKLGLGKNKRTIVVKSRIIFTITCHTRTGEQSIQMDHCSSTKGIRCVLWTCGTRAGQYSHF